MYMSEEEINLGCHFVQKQGSDIIRNSICSTDLFRFYKVHRLVEIEDHAYSTLLSSINVIIGILINNLEKFACVEIISMLL